MSVIVPGPIEQVDEASGRFDFIADIARLGSGGYVVLWSNQGGGSVGGETTHARVYDAGGRPTSGDILVGQGHAGSVTALSGGGFAVAYGEPSTNIKLHLYGSSGTAQGDETIVVTGDATTNVRQPVITTLTDGRLALAWSAGTGAAVGSQVFRVSGEILSPTGIPLTGVLPLGPPDVFSSSIQGFRDLDIAPTRDGGFALVRNDAGPPITPSIVLATIEAQLFGADGTARSGLIEVAQTGVGVSVAALPDGAVAIGYRAPFGSGFFRLLGPDGTLGAAHPVVADGGGFASGPAEVAALPDGRLLVTSTESGHTVAGLYSQDGAKIGLSIKDAGLAAPVALSSDVFALADSTVPAGTHALAGAHVFTRLLTTTFATSDPDGHAGVNDAFYLARNGDVAAAGQDPEQHYHLYGWQEGRDPDALFSSDAYRFANADVRAAGIDPLQHYETSGWRDGRDPSASFDTQLYLDRNPDVKAAGIDPFEHYLQYGPAEGREAFAAIGPRIEHGSFDTEFYLLSNPDVARAAPAGADPAVFAYDQYRTYGWHEGRNPNAFFDTKGYLAANPDVAAAGLDPLAHYDAFGWREGRDPSAGFDTSNYLAANPDVAGAQVDPLAHYLQYGALEARLALGDGLLGTV